MMQGRDVGVSMLSALAAKNMLKCARCPVLHLNHAIAVNWPFSLRCDNIAALKNQFSFNPDTTSS